ncbi:tetratricopeptide repeat protein (plasmid) [Agrobacterium sp. rho-13.3]|uniref:tetratricopeptide repeat protein n=1 Tax=Agrobacterium sp. rho-13.3 TaxID=3072980 RepID=UPI002A144083|nr:tetratricopeptide repeat protein [Agrobacterium sp. rho-13.3]MDX8310187.1 tetratricopeptide repeat protein [Agrobacterium sp. rho-13.3]
MDELIKAGLEACDSGNYKRAVELWQGSTVFSHLNEQTIKTLFDESCDAAIRLTDSEWPLLFKCSLFLDCSWQFTPNRAKSLRDVANWATNALRVAPQNAFAHRFLGSAHYWLEESAPALQSYENSVALLPQVDLQVRIFGLQHEAATRTVAQLELDFSDVEPIHYYIAGVEVGKWTGLSPNKAEADRIAALQLSLYERSVSLFQSKLADPDTSRFVDTHTFAMCCNNLGITYNFQKRHEDALSVLNTGLTHSEFSELHQNLRTTYRSLGLEREAAQASITLLEEFDPEPILFFDCAQTACSYLNRIRESETVLEIVNACEEEFESLSESDQRDKYIIKALVVLHAHKVSAKAQMGELQQSDIDMELVDEALRLFPDDLELLLVRARLLSDKADYNLALASYVVLVAEAEKQENHHVLQGALKARGYLNLYTLNNAKAALKDFKAIEVLGKADFYTFYYQANCLHLLEKTRETISACQQAKHLITPSLVVDDRMSLAQLYMMEANSYFDSNNFGAAVEAYERSLEHHDRVDVRENYELAKHHAAKKKGLLSRLFS